MPLNRRMLAADSDLAEEFSRIAQKNNTSLFSLTNRLIQAYSIIDKLGYYDPVDAAVDLVFYSNIFNTGFRISPPKLDGDDGWEKIGESLWLIISMGAPSVDPRHAIVRLSSILIDEKNVFIYQKEGTRIMISVPINSNLKAKEMYMLLKGFLREALKDYEYQITHRSNVVMISIKTS